jgi:hypothetical protein
MKSIKKQIVGSITLAGFVLGVAGSSMAAAPAAAQPAVLSDYAVSAVQADGSEETNALPLLVAAALLVAYVTARPFPEPLPELAGESVFDL